LTCEYLPASSEESREKRFASILDSTRFDPYIRFSRNFLVCAKAQAIFESILNFPRNIQKVAYFCYDFGHRVEPFS
jgi:hypothetical protein